MATYAELIDKAAEQVLSAVKPINSLTKTFTDTAAGSVRKLPSVPRPEGLPSAREVVTANFAFAEKLFAAQKEFALGLVGAAAGPVKAKASTKG